MKAEKKEISQLSIKDMDKEKVERGKAAIRGTLGAAGSIASIATIASPTTFAPLVIAGPVGFLASSAVGLYNLDKIVSAKMRSTTVKNVNRTDEWLVGSTRRWGAYEMNRIDKKMREKRGDNTVDAIVAKALVSNQNEKAIKMIKNDVVKLKRYNSYDWDRWVYKY